MHLRLPIPVVAVVIAAAACSTTTVTTDWDRTVDFSQYSTYSIPDPAERPPDPLMLQRVEDAIREELGARGFREASSGGDLLVVIHGHGGMQRRVDINHYGYAYRWRGWGRTHTNVTEIPTGTVIVDLVDSGTRELEWRGTATDTVSRNPDTNWNKLNKAIERMFEGFPPE